MFPECLGFLRKTKAADWRVGGRSLYRARTSSATHGQNGITIDDTAIPQAGFRTVVVSIPKALAVDNKLFARLAASVTP